MTRDDCDLIPKALIVTRYFTKEQAVIEEAGSRTGERLRADK